MPKSIQISSNNVDVEVSSYSVTIGGHNLEQLIIKALRDNSEPYSNKMKCIVNISITEIENPVKVLINGEEPKEEVDSDAESEII